MSSVKKLSQEMLRVGDELVANAKELLEVSRGPNPNEKINPLQDTQEELVQTLLALDAELRELVQSEADLQSFWTQMHQKIDEFQALNEKFVSNLSTRKGLIRFEVNDLRRARRNLNSVKKSYARNAPPQKGKRGKGQINTNA